MGSAVSLQIEALHKSWQIAILANFIKLSAVLAAQL